MNYFTLAKEDIHEKYLLCSQCIKWSVGKISGAEDGSGFIVQEVSIGFASESLMESNFTSTRYFAAWKVTSGTIAIDSASDDYDDMFALGDPLARREALAQSLWTKGRVSFSGRVFWIPAGSTLYSTVESWAEGCVPEAKDLRSSYTFEKLDEQELAECFVFARDPFEHCWDLTKEEDVFEVVYEYLSRAYPNNDARDCSLCFAAIDELASYLKVAGMPEKLRTAWRDR